MAGSLALQAPYYWRLHGGYIGSLAAQIFICCSRKAVDRCVTLVKESTVALGRNWVR